ncbi:MAG: TIGR03067 domain-containing protein [Planctomycetes bacterium]|nr:TIGR03067 domain-containing protein [Planctomycetota bacterium]
MRDILHVFCFLAAFLVISPIAGADAKKPPVEVKPLEGAWEVVELTAYGKRVDVKTIKGTKFVFKGDKLTIQPPSDKLEEFVPRSFSFKLFPMKTPAEVELTVLDAKDKGLVSVGIYEIKGDTLRWCQSDATKAPQRPKEFASPDKSPYYLFTLKRAK